MCIWKALKNPKTKVANLIKCGIEKYNAKNGADCYSKNGDAVTVLTWQS